MRTILPSVGVDTLRFGMKPNEVRAVLGDVLQYEDWMGGNLNDFLFYKGILLGFAGDSGDCPSETSELVIIELHGQQPLSLLGNEIGGCTRAQLLHLLASHGISCRTVSSTVIAADQCGLQLTFSPQGLLSRACVQRVGKRSDA